VSLSARLLCLTSITWAGNCRLCQITQRMGPDCRRAAGWTGLWSAAIVRSAPLLNRQGWDLVRVGFRLADEAREPLKKLRKMRRASLHSSSASSSSKRYVGGRPTAIVVPNSEIALLARRDYILDPAGRKGAARPSELYGLTNNEIAHFGRIAPQA
jgi:hypothetical protein